MHLHFREFQHLCCRQKMSRINFIDCRFFAFGCVKPHCQFEIADVYSRTAKDRKCRNDVIKWCEPITAASLNKYGMPKCVYQGSMKITAIEKRKLSSKREDILDNTEPCQTKIRRSQCCCGRTIMVIFRRGKVALLNVITITFSRHYLQITYKLTTFTGVAYGTC